VQRFHGGDGKSPLLFETNHAAYVWPAGEDARPFVTYPHIALGTALALGPPRDGAVPVLLSGRGWAAFQALPLGRKGSPAAPLPMAGWRPVQASSRLDLDATPACPAGAAGALVPLGYQGTNALPLVLDGAKVEGFTFDVQLRLRVEAPSVCLASASYALRFLPHDEGPPLRTLEVDLASGAGRGVETGPRPHVRTLSCSLQRRPGSG
jgi:hypothetical protein